MAAPVPADDRGLLLADGLFETVLSDCGRLDAFEAHAARMIRGCAVLGLPAPEARTLRAAAERALAEAGLLAARAAVRLTWTAGSAGRGLERPEAPLPRLIASAALSPPPAGPVSLAVVEVRRNQGSPAARLKSLAYLDNVLARRAAHALGAEEAVMLNGAGEVACAAAANLFWIEGGGLFTPALDCGVLDGTMRARVLAAAVRLGVPAVEAHAGAEALARAEGLFLTNSLIGIRPASALNGRPVAAHPLIDQLRQAVPRGI